MGISTMTPGILVSQARKSATLEDAVRHYRILLSENARETVLHGHCPFPSHKRHGGKSFRIKVDPTGKMLRWECSSVSCVAVRPVGGDVVALVAAMEDVDLERAAALIVDGLLSA